MSTLAVDDVSISFGGVLRFERDHGHVGAGEIVGIIGPNGAGKTTLLNVICGLNAPDSGEIRFDGVVDHRHEAQPIAAWDWAAPFRPHSSFAA